MKYNNEQYCRNIDIFPPQFKVQTIQMKRAPCSMYRGAAAAIDNNTIYIAPDSSHDIYCYKLKEDTWTTHKARCPQTDFGLIVFNNKVLAIGGQSDDGRVTGKILTLREEHWREELPPLTQPHHDLAVVSRDNFLVSIGGCTSSGYEDPCSSVELFHTGDPAWTSLTSLPTPAKYPSATLIGELIYVMADKEHGYNCQLTDLMANKKPWQPLPPFPHTVRHTPSSCSLGGQLVIVDSDETIWQLIYSRNSSWSVCGTVSGVHRRLCVLASPTPHRMVTVGSGSGYGFTVDVCSVV